MLSQLVFLHILYSESVLSGTVLLIKVNFKEWGLDKFVTSLDITGILWQNWESAFLAKMFRNSPSILIHCHFSILNFILCLITQILNMVWNRKGQRHSNKILREVSEYHPWGALGTEKPTILKENLSIILKGRNKRRMILSLIPFVKRIKMK